MPTAIAHSGAHLLASLCRKCIKFFNYCVEALLSITNYIRIFIGLECLEPAPWIQPSVRVVTTE